MLLTAVTPCRLSAAVAVEELDAGRSVDSCRSD